MTTGLEMDTRTEPATTDGLRFLAIRANLVPGEVLAARAADVTRKRVLIALGALLAVLAIAFGASWWQTHAANNDLSAEQRRASTLQAQTHSFAPLVAAQGATTSVRAQLQRLMTGDVSWQQMLTSLQSQAPTGVTLTQVSGTITAAAGAPGTTTGTTNTLPSTGAASVGSLTLTGTARDKVSVANYTDALAATKGLSAPFVNSVTAGDHDVTFNLTVPITSAALGGRWTPTAGQHTGGN